MRCVHEASLYSNNCFITLTYNDNYLPENLSLDKEAFVLFMKRLRKRFGSGIRFYMCGEYGSLNLRPHYHACIFNHDFEDKYLWNIRDGVRLYRSPSLEELWPFGFATVGDVTFESAAYVARYIMKKVIGSTAEDHYSGRVPEYNNMSRRPGVGRAWFEQYKDDVYPHDYVVIRDGIKCRPPRYYDLIYDLEHPEEFGKIKEERKEKGRELSKKNTKERLVVKEEVARKRLERLIRSEV